MAQLKNRCKSYYYYRDTLDKFIPFFILSNIKICEVLIYFLTGGIIFRRITLPVHSTMIFETKRIDNVNIFVQHLHPFLKSNFVHFYVN